MEGCSGSRGGNRRRFLKTTAAAGVSLASVDMLRAAAAEPAVPTVTLGRTGRKVTKLGMGTSWALQPNFVQAALLAGVRYIDTSESYENTRAEQVLGPVIERTNLRKEVYLVSKCNSYKNARGAGAAKVFEEHLEASLKRLRTDYVDCYYIHGIGGANFDMLADPSVKEAFAKLKASGKIKFCGISCHDPKLPELLTEAARVGWIDQAMIQYNFRVVDHDKLQRAVDAAVKADMGLVAMKTQKGAESYPDKVAKFTEKGFKKEVAAIKSVWTDQRMHVVVSEMTNFSDLRENVAASKEELTQKEARLLEEYRQKTSKMYCHGCGHLCETAAKGVQVAEVMRYLRYYEVYGKRDAARALYQALPPAARAVAEVKLDLVDAACPHGLPVADLLKRAEQRLA